MRVLVVLAAALAIVAAAGATAPPIKYLPIGQPISTITTTKGELVSIALPSKAGLSWRLARNSAPGRLREVHEANVGSSVVIVFKALAKGHAKVVYAATRGESTTAAASRTYLVTIR